MNESLHELPHTPADLDAERAILASCLCDPRAIALVSDLDPRDLYDVRHGAVLRVMLDLFGDDVACEPLTVANRLRAQPEERWGGMQYLVSLAAGGGYTPNLPEYAESVRRWGRLRRAASAAHKASSAMGLGDTEAAESAFGSVAQHLSGVEKRNPVVSFEQSGAEVLERLFSEREARAVGLSTGFQGIDDGDLGLLGFHRTHLTVLAARPAMGKTALALNLAWNVAKREGPVLFSCGEMSHTELTERVLAYVSQVPYPSIRAGRMTYADRDRVRAAYNELCHTPLYLWDKAGVTSNDVLAKTRWVAAKTGRPVAMVVVDYLQRMGCDVRYRDKRLTVEHNAEALKTMASNEHVHVLLLSQLNRACEQRENKRPAMSDLRESGAIEQEANEVLMLYREHVYAPDMADPREAELICRKARGAQTGTMFLRWQGELMTFRG